ncbi:hypothetical protein ZEAMMB73_Zm00001d007405 [Zea mays]|uniref:Uncharacterized protein n=2 Tax=Zea mays TaxID=4577 RepID=A0A1D6F650_MAIZE|nr:hypothetical protein ZEAMMB73_Zm00001d007405 [Zea mays]
MEPSSPQIDATRGLLKDHATRHHNPPKTDLVYIYISPFSGRRSPISIRASIEELVTSSMHSCSSGRGISRLGSLQMTNDSAFRWAQRIRSYHIRKGESVEQCLACHSYMCSAWRSGLSYSHVRLLQRSSKPIKISRLWALVPAGSPNANKSKSRGNDPDDDLCLMDPDGNNLKPEMLAERSCSKTNLCRDYGYTKLYKGGGSEFCASQEAFRSISLFFEFMRAAQDNITALMELDGVIRLDWI